MSLVIKNSTASTTQKPLVNIEGADYSVSDLVAIANEAGKVRTSSTHQETLEPYVAPAADESTAAAPAATKHTVSANGEAGLQTPA